MANSSKENAEIARVRSKAARTPPLQRPAQLEEEKRRTWKVLVDLSIVLDDPQVPLGRLIRLSRRPNLQFWLPPLLPISPQPRPNNLLDAQILLDADLELLRGRLGMRKVQRERERIRRARGEGGVER